MLSPWPPRDEYSHVNHLHLRLLTGAVSSPSRPAAIPLRARCLIAATALATVVPYLLAGDRIAGQDWGGVILLGVLGMAAERFDISVYGESRISVSALFMITAALALGPTAALIVCPMVAVGGHVGRGRPLYKLVFNASVFTLAALASAETYRLALGLDYGDMQVVRPVGMILAAVANFAVSSVLVACIIAFTGGLSVRAVWREKFPWLLPHFAAMGLLAFPLTLAYGEFGVFGLAGFVAPVFMTRVAMKQYVDRTERTVTELREKHAEVEGLSRELAEAYNDTIAAFVSALDVRDVETHGHSIRVADLSLAIGQELGLQEGSREWLDLKHGALLHDVGKIGVPDAILRKPDSLSEDEWKIVQTHPSHGYRMLRGVHFLESAAELVFSHHERLDGGGYPRGLEGDQIPLAARIFAVADAFDAITSERPYKKARSDEEACYEIGAHSGTQFDPHVVEVLLRLKRSPRSRAA